ncbi:MAG TPA: type II toxin-antitoxin system antitoxin SocA domain-containing protein [Beijerinckiaceae bacterium]|jgi:uncharacterized phage-associated protein
MVDLASPRSVADFLLVESRERGELLTNLKLQKLLYYADGWHAAESPEGRPLFEEVFQAWVHGPVLPSQYRRFKDFKWRPIDLDVATPEGLSPEVRRHLTEIIDVFGSETAVALELMTHREPPWIEARGALAADAPSTAAISKDTMRRYFRFLADDQKAQA